MSHPAVELAGAEVEAVRSAGDAADKGYDMIFESVGGSSMEEAVRRVAAHGTAKRMQPFLTKYAHQESGRIQLDCRVS